MTTNTKLFRQLDPLITNRINQAIDAALTRTVIVTGQSTQSGGGSTYTGGDGIDIASNIISVDVTDVIDTSYGLTESGNDIRVNLAGTSGLSFNSGALELADTVAGSGLAIASKVLSVNVGNGLEVSGDAVLVDLATTSGLTFSGGDLAVDPDDGIDIVAGGVAVDVTDLLGFGITEEATNNLKVDVTAEFNGANAWTKENEFSLRVRTPTITADADLTLSPADDLWLNPGNQVLAPNAQDIRSETYFDLWAGITGWRIWELATNYNQLTIGNIKADGLAVRVFVADEVRVDRGEEIWSKSYGIVAYDDTLPADEATRNMWFENAASLSGAAIFSANDWLLCQIIDWGTGLYISRIWWQVVARVSDTWTSSTSYAVGRFVANNGTDAYRCIVAHTSSAANEPGTGGSWSTYWEEADVQAWTLRRKYGGTTGDTVKAGSLMVDVGQSGQGWVHLSALEDAGGPFIQIGDWTGDPSGADIINSFSVYTRMGNLNGLADYSADTWGFVAGLNLDSSTESNWQGVYIDATNGVRMFGVNIDLYEGGWKRGHIDSDGSFFFGYKSGANITAADPGFVFNSPSGNARLGNPTGNQVLWTQSTGTLAVTGTITVTGGSGIASFSDAGTLATADNLDDVPDGTTYERVYSTIITGHYIQTGSGTKDSTLNGWNIGTSEIVGQLSGADQVVLNTSGQILAGGGYVQLDSNGISLSAPATEHQLASVDWVHSGDIVARVSGYFSTEPCLSIWAGGSGYNGTLYIKALDTAGTGGTILNLDAGSITLSGARAYIPSGVNTNNNVGYYVRSTPGGSAISVVNLDTSNDLVIGSGLTTQHIDIARPVRIDGTDTITSNPTSADVGAGWKMSLSSTNYAIGVGYNAFVIKTGNAVEFFDDTNPANDANLDSNAYFYSAADYLWTSAALGSAWADMAYNTGDNWGTTSASYHDAGYKKFGDMVMLRGNVSRSSGSGAANITGTALAAAYRPTKLIVFNRGGSVIHMTTAGHLYFASGTDDDISLEGLYYSISAA